MRSIPIQPTFESWRDAARGLLAAAVNPGDVLWCDDAAEVSLFGDNTQVSPVPGKAPKVPAVFFDIAKSAAAHTDPRRWGVLYRIAWRITHGGEKRLLEIPTDPDTRLVQQWCKAVGREIHKMHAFVRFRRVGVDEETGREQFVAWFEPVYQTIRLGSPFFVKRFASMDWSILTPHECAHWDGGTLHFTPGVSKETAPDEDALDDLWRAYYGSIFNPARLKVNAMRSEMPNKYWKNLPEASLIKSLIAESQQRVKTMLDAEELPVKHAPKNAYLESLRRMNGETND
ncbi:MAG: TIGR03915 family putative DNA repair protein [Luteolibacter sp.]|uniref:TIGR03915 family putative DNA repair protein n=1 Tax=Luteolibacter sp. TaxID=1962973 RepID=UPI0032669AFF